MKHSSSPLVTASPSLDVETVRAQFPILATQAHGHPLVYLDNAASAQKPRAVVEVVSDYYLGKHANIHRGAYLLSQTATRLYEEARERIARFINAAEPAECLFTRGTTESINLVAASWGMQHLGPGDEIVLSVLEHHSNIVPWQLVAERTGAKIRVIPIDDAGDLQLDVYYRLLSPRTKLVAVGHVSNALGTINPVAEIIAAAHAVGALVLVDGAQWVAHGNTDVQALDADFYAFSGHKLYGPTGIGVLYGKRRLLDAMPPYQGGGDMIERVTFTETTFAELPNKFEAGTPHIAGAVGLAAAIDWLDGLGLEAVAAHEAELLHQATARLGEIPGLEIKGTARHKAGVLSWVAVDPPISTLDMGTQLDLEGICVRTGHHCCEPLMDHFGVTSTARASFGVYNNHDDVERLAIALAKVFATAHRRLGVVREAASTETIDYPGAAAPSPSAVAEDIRELFEALPDWPMRYQQLIELGENLPPMPEELKTQANFVSGCQSQVHLAARLRPGSEDLIEFLADADADIVRGLIAILQQLFSGQRAAEILAFDTTAFFADLGLDQHLSLTRRNGLAAMVQRLRQLAGQYERAVAP
ncbi:cysteine desulfurase-like protein, SufS subfamily [Thioflavicoccus mobilis 8321]|uniref:cysteine desulfurase n=1 Tax=Thioflavicoccus mobilis 8321 TaxID=765912 RepID=L0H0P9_9GAMM|nr:SufS family cysteine desulfurase [Thioflavicoccus mobilis]AGA91159.1 cysteine desulfurase-like protein, SufS subfamily [Thioflavicoccus mobilis 8321]